MDETKSPQQSQHTELQHDEAVSLRSSSPTPTALPQIDASNNPTETNNEQTDNFSANAADQHQTPEETSTISTHDEQRPQLDTTAPNVAPAVAPATTLPAPVQNVQTIASPYALPTDNTSNVYEADAHYVDDGSEGFSWTASEFIDHQRTTQWYVALGLIAVVAGAAGYLVSHDVVVIIAIAFGAILLGSMGAMRPRQLRYTLNYDGISVGQKFYPYSHFRSFSITDDGAFSSIDFAPLRRFDLPMSVYYDPDNEDDILEVLMQHLPLDNRAQALTDRVVRRLRF